MVVVVGRLRCWRVLSTLTWQANCDAAVQIVSGSSLYRLLQFFHRPRRPPHKARRLQLLTTAAASAATDNNNDDNNDDDDDNENNGQSGTVLRWVVCVISASV
jgi:hypothetical protein